jgi:hypothetical protein
VFRDGQTDKTTTVIFWGDWVWPFYQATITGDYIKTHSKQLVDLRVWWMVSFIAMVSAANFMSWTPARVWGRCLCKCRINPQEKSMVDREFDDQPWDFGDKNMFFSELWWNYLCEFYGFWGYPMCQASGVPLGKESTDFVKHWIFEVPIGALCLGKTIFRRPDSSDWNWKIWAKTTKLNNIYIYINNWFTVHGLPTTHI